MKYIIGIAGVIVVGVLYWYLPVQSPLQQSPAPVVVNDEVEIIIDDLESGEIKFKGVVMPGGQDTCSVDGTCSIMVGDTEVIWGEGWPQEPRGSMDDNIQIGKAVEVYGKKEMADVVSIYGSEKYYIRVISE